MASVSPLRAFGAHRVHHPFEGKIDTRRRRRLKDAAKSLPRAPGVYFFFGTGDRLLYIGKAKCLRERVGSYFGETSLPRPPKLRRLLAEITRLEHLPCGSELEALLVERRLIADRLPILNRQHKRFEVYPYLLLSDEEFPRLTLTRAEPVAERMKDEGERLNEEAETDELHPSSFILHPSEIPRAGELPGLYLGPFTTPRAAWWTFEAVRNLFPLRSCEGEIVPDENHRACFYHDIGRCAGPCIGAVSRGNYAKLCSDLLEMLRTGQSPQLENLRARMQKCSDEWRFEDAAKLKEQLQAIEIVAARLRRLQRMREQNNVAIAQPALPDENGNPRTTIFLVQGGAVRKSFVVDNWKNVRAVLRDLFANPPAPPDFTAKTELDEMMILDRWLQAHGTENCCVWMSEIQRENRQWTSNAVRQLRQFQLQQFAAQPLT